MVEAIRYVMGMRILHEVHCTQHEALLSLQLASCNSSLVSLREFCAVNGCSSCLSTQYDGLMSACYAEACQGLPVEHHSRQR